MLPKVVILGVDGISYQFLLDLVSQGEMPHLAKALEQGHMAPLTSTIPPITPAAFSASYTGKNPDRNNVYGFFHRKPGTYDMVPTSAADRRKPDLWDIIHHWGERPLVIGMPFTYPVRVAEDFAGVIITGFSPSESLIDVYPPELRSIVLEENGYKIVKAMVYKPHVFAESITSRFDLAVRMLERAPYDCLMLGFGQLDAAHHRFQARKLAVLVDLYRHLDRELGAFIKRFPPETLFLLYSDHGHKVYKKAFNVNAWLVQNGYLSLRGSKEVQEKWSNRATNPLARAAMMQLRRLYAYLYRRGLIETIKRFVHPFVVPEFLRFGNVSSTDLFDYGRSKVYSLEGVANFVFLMANIIDRDPLGTIPNNQVQALGEQLRHEFLALKDPSTGTPIIKNFWLAEELYPAGKTEPYCDFIVEAHEDYIVVDWCYSPEELERLVLDYLFSYHEMTGVIAYWGNGLAGVEPVDSMHLVDICPTILHAMGLPMPDDLDGRPAMLSQEMSARRVETFDSSAELKFGTASSEPVYTREEEEQIKERLRDLGYL